MIRPNRYPSSAIPIMRAISSEFTATWHYGNDSYIAWQLFYAERHAALMEFIAARLSWPRGPRMLDIGGAYGCLGFELAAKGWQATVVDNDATKTEGRGPWLQERLPQPRGSVDFATMGMEEISALLAKRSDWDAITFFRSLCHSDREAIPAMLQACWQRILPGGALVVQEYIPEDAILDSLQFERDELLKLVSDNTTAPEYLHVADRIASSQFTGTLLAVKPR